MKFNLAVVLMSSGVIKLSLKSFFGIHYLNYGTLYAIIFSSVYFFIDLSAYSDLMQGFSKLIGLELCYNFNLPFLQKTVSALWRNWHISLYNWFTEYVFEPLVYSRSLRRLSAIWRYSLGVLVTFLLIGMWHRINLNYIIWGSVATLFVVLEQMVISKGFKAPRWLSLLGIPYVLLTMGILRYISDLPGLTFSSIGLEWQNFIEAHIFNLYWMEEWILVGLQIFTILILSLNDYIILRKPQYVTRLRWTLFYLLIASFIYFSMYVPGRQEFSYGRI